VYREFKEILRKAGLPDIRFHDLRHTAATLMLRDGIHPKIVQERLGHAQIYITMDTYPHILPTMQDEVAKKMDELIAPIQEGVKAVNPYDG
jgi:integrase